jgi:hypothetical protein
MRFLLSLTALFVVSVFAFGANQCPRPPQAPPVPEGFQEPCTCSFGGTCHCEVCKCEKAKLMVKASHEEVSEPISPRPPAPPVVAPVVQCQSTVEGYTVPTVYMPAPATYYPVQYQQPSAYQVYTMSYGSAGGSGSCSGGSCSGGGSSRGFFRRR